MAKKGILGNLIGSAKSASEPTHKHRKTEVRDKFFGGKQVKTTEVVEKGNKVQVREHKRDLDDYGRKVKESHTVSGDEM